MVNKVTVGKGNNKKCVIGVPTWHAIASLSRENRSGENYLVTEYPLGLTDEEIRQLDNQRYQASRIMRYNRGGYGRSTRASLRDLYANTKSFSDREKGRDVYVGRDEKEMEKATDVNFEKLDFGFHVAFKLLGGERELILGRRRYLIRGGERCGLKSLSWIR